MAESALSSADIQRALQHAVVEANNAFSQSNTTKKKKTKRSQQDGKPTKGSRHAVNGVKRKQDVEQDIAEGQAVNPEPAVNAENLPSHRPKKKRRKNDKGKQPDITSEAQQHFPQIDPRLASASNPGPQASPAAFISAIVAAASDSEPHTSNQPVGHYPPSHPGLQSQPYLTYPPIQYEYPQLAPPPPTVFPTLTNLSLPDLSLGSNDDMLRALQDLDMSKIASVLKTLSEAAAAASVSPEFIGQQPMPSRPVQASTLGQLSTASEDILGRFTEKAKDKVSIDGALPEPENPDHAYILANKWMNASKLADMVKTQGLVYKKGKFSAIEEQQLRSAVENYRILKQLSPEQIYDIIFVKNDKGKDNSFWSEITAAVPQRPIIAVYHHVRRTFHRDKQKGPWQDKEDTDLKQAVADFGQQWEKVSARVGRMSSDCRDRYRNHIANRDIRVTGHWTQEEEEELTRIVMEMTIKQGKDIDHDVFWGKVAERMGNKRGRQQCRIKWTDSLSKTVKNDGQKPRWSQQDAYILVHKVDSLNVRDDTEIDWKTLSDDQWKLWSAHTLQRRWSTLKRGIKGFEDMTHQEIMDILRVKKAHPPGPSAQKKKVVSAAVITDSETGPSVLAGSSTGPGTKESTRRNLGTEHDDSDDSDD